MAERSSLKPAAVSFPTLTPQGQQVGKPAMALNRPFTLIGARNRAHLHLVSSTVSRSHACVISTDNGLYVRDLASRTGAIVNGRRVKEADLRDGDTLQIGSFKFKFADPAGPVRFPLTPKAAAAVLDMDGNQTPLDTRTVLIGRRVTCDIPLTEQAVSNTHALIFEVNGHRFVRDLGSRTGTLVNGKPIHHQLLEFGDEIRIGTTVFRYASAHDEEVYEEEAPATSEPGETALDLEEDLEPIGIAFKDEPLPLADETTDAASDDLTAPIPLHEEEVEQVSNDLPTPQGPISVVTASVPDVSGLIPLDTVATHPPEESESEPLPESIATVEATEGTAEVSGGVSGIDVGEPEVAATDAGTDAADAFNLHLDSEPESIDLAEPIALEEPAAEQHFDRPEAPQAEEAAPVEMASEPESVSEPLENQPIEPLAAAEESPPTSAAESGHYFTGSEHFFTSPVPEVETPHLHDAEAVTDSPSIESQASEAPAGEVEPDLSSAEDDSGPSPAALEELAQGQSRDRDDRSIEPELTSVEAEATDSQSVEPAPQPESATVDLSAMHFEQEAAVDQTLTETTEPVVESTDEPKPLLDLAPEPPAETEQSPESTLTTNPADLSDAPPVTELASPTLEPAPVPKGKRRGRPPKNPTAPSRRGRKKGAVEPPVTPDVAISAVIAPLAIAPLVTPPLPTPLPAPEPATPKRRPGRRKRPAEPTLETISTPPDDTAAVETPEEPAPTFEAPDQPVAISGWVSDVQSVVISTSTSEPETIQPETIETEPTASIVEEDSRPALDSELEQPVEVTSDLTPEPVEMDAIDSSPVEEPVVAPDSIDEPSHALTADAATLEAVPEIQSEPEVEPIAQLSPLMESIGSVDEPAPADIAHQAPTATDERFEELAIPLVEPIAEEPAQLEPESIEIIEPEAVSSSLEQTPEPELSHLTTHEGSIEESPVEVPPVEVMEPTLPDPESAQGLEPTLDEFQIEDFGPEVSEPDAGLTDTAFGRVVEGLGSSDSGPLVENAATAAEAIHAPEAAELPAEIETSEKESPAPDLAQPPLVEPLMDSQEEHKEIATEIATPEVESKLPAAEPQSHQTESAVDDFDLGSDSFDLPDVDFSIDLAETEKERGVGLTAASDIAEDLDEDRTPGADTSISSSLPHATTEEEVASPEFEEPRADLSHDGTPAENESHSALVDFEPDFTLESDEPIEFDKVEEAPPAPSAKIEPPPAVPPAPVAPAPAAEVPPPAPPRPAMDPFFGMSRDLASFIGGAPLVLSSAAPTSPPPRIPAPPPPAPEKAPATGHLTSPPNLDDPVPEIDFSHVDEESMDLFEGAPEKLDAIPEKLTPIGDVTGVFSSPEARHPLNPPAPAAAPRQPQPGTPPPALRAAPFRQVTPPPPTRNSPLRSLTSGPQSVAPPPNFPPVEAAPPFMGLGSPQRTPAPFGSPGAPPIREVDVFSHTAFPPIDPSVFGAPQQRPATPPHPRRQSFAEPAPDAGLSVVSRGTPSKDPVLPNRQAPIVAAATETPPAPRRRRWWRSMKFLLSMMIVAIVVVVAIVMLYSNHKTLEGSLQMQGADLQGSGAHERANALRRLAASPHVVQLAVASTKEQNVPAGFLDRPDQIAALTDPLNSPYSSEGKLSFRVPSKDPADVVRLLALLNAVFAESGAGNDAAASHRNQLKADQARLAEFQNQKATQDAEMKMLAGQLAVAGANVISGMDPAMSIAESENEDRQRQRDLNQAADLVKQRREALAESQAQAASVDAGAARTLDRVRQAIAELNVRLDAIKLAQSGQSDEAARRFDTALDAFGKKVESIPADADAAMLAYRARANETLTQIHALNSQLSEREHQDVQAVNQLRSQIGDRREAHLTRVWAGDATLGQLAEERNAQAHRYAVASDSGIGDEAAKIKGVLEDIDHKIEARRSALATGAALSDDLQRNLQTAIDRMESDRLVGEQQLAAKLKELLPPASDTASPQQQQLAGDLKSGVATLTTTRQAYASASSLSASEAQDEARKIEAQISEQQARLDTLRQGGGANDPVQLARTALDQAQAAEEKAATAYTSAHGSLALLRQYADARSAGIKLAEAIKAQSEQVKLTQEAVTSAPVVAKPTESSVKQVMEEDRRVNYLVTGIGAIILIFGSLMWFSGAPQPVAVAHIETLHDVEREPRDARHDDAFGDDEHPLIA